MANVESEELIKQADAQLDLKTTELTDFWLHDKWPLQAVLANLEKIKAMVREKSGEDSVHFKVSSRCALQGHHIVSRLRASLTGAQMATNVKMNLTQMSSGHRYTQAETNSPVLKSSFMIVWKLLMISPIRTDKSQFHPYFSSFIPESLQPKKSSRIEELLLSNKPPLEFERQDFLEIAARGPQTLDEFDEKIAATRQLLDFLVSERDQAALPDDVLRSVFWSCTKSADQAFSMEDLVGLKPEIDIESVQPNQSPWTRNVTIHTGELWSFIEIDLDNRPEDEELAKTRGIESEIDAFHHHAFQLAPNLGAAGTGRALTPFCIPSSGVTTFISGGPNMNTYRSLKRLPHVQKLNLLCWALIDEAAEPISLHGVTFLHLFQISVFFRASSVTNMYSHLILPSLRHLEISFVESDDSISLPLVSSPDSCRIESLTINLYQKACTQLGDELFKFLRGTPELERLHIRTSPETILPDRWLNSLVYISRQDARAPRLLFLNMPSGHISAEGLDCLVNVIESRRRKDIDSSDSNHCALLEKVELGPEPVEFDDEELSERWSTLLAGGLIVTHRE
ncbi:hypothetical protein EV421DRAFT_1738192 [Armillaria borealis]|uniref:Uncharacterized protein n=1 Tax=Armillaria borealis TaxID=47425 RepID=A0AA39MM57_9AGAR|nr:hypothetical protein EV421DRAFT_1738192 [Armillaria borealis]